MPTTALDLVEERSFPVCVKMRDSVSIALDLMIEHDYSQLPVIDDDNFPKGLITSDSILRGAANLNVPVKTLRVQDVVEKHVVARIEVSIFDLLDTLDNHPAVLITDNSDRLCGITTSADAAEYFRRRAEDLMLVEDIETYLQEHINAAFTDPELCEVNKDELQKAIDEVFNAPKVSSAREAIARYQSYIEGENGGFNSTAFEQLREQLTAHGKELGDLTLNQLIEMFLHKSRWTIYGKNFSVSDAALRTLLTEITKIRNTLAHFRDELTTGQREQLRWCAEWFKNNPAILPETITEEPSEEVSSAVAVPETVPLAELEIDTDSRYAKLALHLQEQTFDQVRLTFKEIEEIIASPLPQSAYEHRSWWANDSKSHVQSQQWLDAGWRVSAINMSEGAVKFVRAKEREAAYINFFSPLLNELRERATFEVRDDTLIGSNWLNVISTWDPNIQYWVTYALSFARGKRFRAELYLYAPQMHDKRVFERMLEQKEVIEAELGEELSWERLEKTRATRIAIYHPGYILDSQEELNALRQWGIDALIRLEKATHARVTAAVESL